ncbi:MAG: hypothetical protein JO043_06865 [Candidatus Eremiobacteraeota bacterium]|nr:hypothetical protein [Candidatus Eremiobacteraeota bacterium]
MHLRRSSLFIFSAVIGMAAVAAGTATSSAHVTLVPLVRPAPVYPGLQVDGCASKGGVSASPCPVTLTMSNPAQAVTVTAPSGDTISEKDNCTMGSNSIAMVQGSGSNWVVSSGNTKGHCKAIFTAKNSSGHKVGRASLPITNKFAIP